MSDDLAAQIANLRAVRDATSDPAQQAALDAAIASMQASMPVPAANPSPAPQTMTVQSSTVGIAHQGDHYGHIFISGQRTRSNEQLLAGYLGRLIKSSRKLPLYALREQRTAEDTLTVSLDQVYTQLATTHQVEREVYEDDDLASFEAEAYLEAHTGDSLLPLAQRTTYRARSRDPEATPMGRHADAMDSSLDRLTADSLARIAQESVRLVFHGPQLVTEAIATAPRLVLLGEPGSGKSTALKYLSLRLAEAGLTADLDPADHLEGWAELGERGRFLPLFVPLLPFAQHLAQQPDHPGTCEDLWNYLAAHLERSGGCAGLAQAVHDELEAGRVLLMLDGLDEVAGSDSRRRVIQTVQAFATEYHASPIVVSCRIRAYEGEHNVAWQLPGWPVATLDDWRVGQMQHFVRAWYGAAASASGMPDERRDERVEALQRAIQRRDDLQRLGIRPLLMTIMALVHFNDGRLPEERVRLYHRCVDLFLGQWEMVREVGTEYKTLMDYIGMPDTEVKALRPLLQQAAFQAHEAARTADTTGSLGRDPLRLMVADELQRKGHPDALSGAEWFLEYTDVRAGLLQASDAGEAYTFPHLTFQEYLAGLELVSRVKSVEHIMERRTDDRWRVPILLGIGHLVSEGALSEPYRLMTKLLHAPKRSDEQQQRDLLLVAEIGEDVGWDSLEQGDDLFTQVRTDLAEKLAEVVGGSTLPARERVQAGRYLGDLGDPRPGVCMLPPDMVQIEGGSVVIGSTPEVAERAGKAFEQYYLDQGDQETAKRARTWPEDEINDQPVTVAPFMLARHPLTNAQYAIFIENDGYNPDQPWWDEAARAWLARDDFATEGLERWQQRRYKQHPEWWHDERVGIVYPNRPVVGISWYECVAFCRWLTQSQTHNPEGFIYRLPTEAEWEYAARGQAGRTYPWGNEEPDDERANYAQKYGYTTPVGCFSPGATPDHGLLDMPGNVLEWTGTVYASYPYDPQDGREDASNPAEKRFCLRGGSWYEHMFWLRASGRFLFSPGGLGLNAGLRLARYLP